MKIYTNYNFLGNSIQNAVMHPVAALPSAAQVGQVCYLTAGDNAGLYVYNGSWVRLADTTDIQAVLTAVNDHISAAEEAYATKEFVGEIPADSEAETIVEYVDEKSAADVEAITALINAIKNGENINDFAATEVALGNKVDKKAGYSLVSDTEIARLAEVDNYDDEEVRGLISDNADAIDAIEADYVKHAEISDFATKGSVKEVSDALGQYKTDNDAALAGVKATADAAAAKTYVDGELAKKADKSVVDAMYTNAKIDELVQSAKDYADAQDANTTYGIVYDSDAKEIKLVEGGTELVIDATDFIKDGMVSNVELNADNDLVITFNTDAGEEDIVVPLDKLIDVYSGIDGDRIKVTVEGNNIKADIKAGTISKTYLDADVQASLGKADSALQSHQDISHLATKTELENVDKKFADYTTTVDLNTELAKKADKSVVDAMYTNGKIDELVAGAISTAAGTAQEKVDALANGQVKTNKEAIAENVTAINNIKTTVTGTTKVATHTDKVLTADVPSVTLSTEAGIIRNIKVYDADNNECIVNVKRVDDKNYTLTAAGLATGETLSIVYDVVTTISL